ncbi:invasion associated locus B family protein [Roseovarius faecimaris]|uniref:Invasion associated locus B family protein n=1 Tax=Roseovarius faecimaris TaxID=2494550 RepID=A0A6I6IQL2_9RHOB|nr:invasion associated locus B family protein [Roseovarius faecimaris]QGX98161.1 invasion associated locus B family protein [Roseovarius faecimaris]
MSKLLYTLPMLALLGLAGAVQAQDNTAATTEEPAAEGTETSGADTGLDMGQEVVEDPTYIKAEYGDWQLKCFRSEAEEDPCQMFQLLREESGNPIAEFSLFRLPEGSQAVAGATIVVPLGTLLTEQLKIAVDSGKAKGYSYSFCSLVGCYARIGLTKADLDAFRRGIAANLTIVPAQAPDQQVTIKASLKGFTAAFENASVLEN